MNHPTTSVFSLGCTIHTCFFFSSDVHADVRGHNILTCALHTCSHDVRTGIKGSQTHSIVPPSLAGKVVWNATVRSQIHAAYFKIIAHAIKDDSERSNGGGSANLEEINFVRVKKESAQPLASSLTMPTVPSMVGWRLVSATTGETTAAFVIHLGALPTEFHVGAALKLASTAKMNATTLYAKTKADLVTPLLPVAELGHATVFNGDVSAAVTLEPYSVLTVSSISGRV